MLRVGQQVGSYQLTRLLGKGSFAEVYLGVDIRLGTEVAIKLLHAQLVESVELEKFQHEARTIARLEHPNIVRIRHFAVEEGTPYLVMDYAPNGSLRRRMTAGRPGSPATIAPYVQQIAGALQHAHDQKLIHRDIKPENMLLGRHNEALLSDFGIAVALQQTRSHLTVYGFSGTAVYAAPEQFQNQVSPASDQYALAVVVYEWLTGERPFQGDDLIAIGMAKVQQPPPLREKLPALAPELEQVVLTALARDPKERFANVRAFANAFEQAAQRAAPPPFVVSVPAPEPAPQPTLPVAPAPLPQATLPVPLPAAEGRLRLLPGCRLSSGACVMEGPPGASRQRGQIRYL
jgi:serine/threonine protein kinase